METFRDLLDLVSPRPAHAVAPPGPKRRLFLACSAGLSSMALAAVWGLSSNATSWDAALGNAVKVPMLIVVSAVAALPLVMLLCKLVGGPGARASDLLVAHAVATFGGTLVLAALSPIVALYQHSSAWAGTGVALGSAVAGGVAGALLLVRAVRRLGGEAASRRAFLVPVCALVAVQLLAMSQLASVTSPVLAHRTAFGRGVDGLAQRGSP
jgi:hypothetical protein